MLINLNIGDWVNDLKPDDFKEPYKTIAQIAGGANALKIGLALQGTYQYFPKLDELIRVKRDEMIKTEFNGCNYKDLAIKYRLSENWIRKIVDGKSPYEQITMDISSE